jgi:hypothetical protein
VPVLKYGRLNHRLIVIREIVNQENVKGVVRKQITLSGQGLEMGLWEGGKQRGQRREANCRCTQARGV